MRFLTFFILLLLGLGVGFRLAPFEEEAVRNYLIGFPNADARLHGLRPWAVVGLCLVPALGALWYSFASILDRYLFRRSLVGFLIATATLLLLFVLIDLQDTLPDFAKAANPQQFIATYYAVFFSEILVLLLPFTTLLGLLFALGQLSASREIIAFTQSGRGIFCLLYPLLILGVLLSLASFTLNYHLAPWARGYRSALLQSASRDVTAQASNVMFHNPTDRRLWHIGGFPYDLSGQTPLTNVQISSSNPDGSLQSRFQSPSVTWNRETGDWIFAKPSRLLVQSEPTPEYEEDLPDPLILSGWSETPSQLIQEGLDARFLGIPGIQDWLQTNPDRETFRARSFYSQYHYRWARPWLCLVTVLLAAPLGISFSRGGPRGTIVIAVALSGLMLFSSEVFLAFGDSGYLPPIPAAWATSGLFLLVALFLIQRRFAGRPIFQSLRKCFES